ISKSSKPAPYSSPRTTNEPATSPLWRAFHPRGAAVEESRALRAIRLGGVDDQFELLGFTDPADDIVEADGPGSRDVDQPLARSGFEHGLVLPHPAEIRRAVRQPVDQAAETLVARRTHIVGADPGDQTPGIGLPIGHGPAQPAVGEGQP